MSGFDRTFDFGQVSPVAPSHLSPKQFENLPLVAFWLLQGIQSQLTSVLDLLNFCEDDAKLHSALVDFRRSDHRGRSKQHANGFRAEQFVKNDETSHHGTDAWQDVHKERDVRGVGRLFRGSLERRKEYQQLVPRHHAMAVSGTRTWIKRWPHIVVALAMELLPVFSSILEIPSDKRTPKQLGFAGLITITSRQAELSRALDDIKAVTHKQNMKEQYDLRHDCRSDQDRSRAARAFRGYGWCEILSCLMAARS